MAGDSPTQLPAYIALRYEENGVFDKFTSEADAAAAQTKRRFEAAFKEVESVTSATFQRMAKGPGKIDLGLSGMRQEAADLKLYRDMLLQIGIEAKRLAAVTGDTTEETTAYIRALQAQRSEASRALEIAERQVSTYTRLQAAIDGSTAANKALADSQRQVYAEQAKAIAVQESERRAMDRKQGLYSSAYGMDRTPKSARDSASVFENWSIKAGPDLRDAVQRLRDGDAAIDRAAVSAVTLETVLGRVATKGQAVKEALQEAARATAEASRTQVTVGPSPANALPTNTKFGADAIVAGQAAMDRAAISGATLENVLGRVAGKSKAVTDAITAQAQAHARATADIDRLSAAVDRLNAELDPVAASAQRAKADIALLDSALAKGAITAERHAEMMDLVSKASHLGTTAFGAVTNSAGAMRVAMLQSGQQLQDIAISLYSGQQAGVVFAQQLPQLAFALTGLEGSTSKSLDRLGKFSRFLSGPWGLAVGLGVGVLSTLIFKMVATGEASDDLVQKLKDEAKETERTRKAQELFKDTAEGVKKAIDEQKAALDKQADALKTETERSVESAKATLNKEIAIRRQTKAILDNLIAQEQANEAYARSPNAAKDGTAGQAMAELSQERVQAARWKLAEQDASIAIAKDNLAVANSFFIVERASESAETTINRRYNAQIEAARRAAVASGKVASALEAEVRAINKARKAELDRIKETSSASNRQYGREIDMTGAKSIASAAGFRVTSDFRTRAEQQWLYDNRRTKENPVALPGTSAHEKGNALDIAFGPGVSAASIKKAYADQGVRLSKILKETGHFHIEWTTSGADKAVAEARQLESLGDAAAESIARINERYDEQPRLIDRIKQDTRQLDDIIKDLMDRKPVGFEKMVADAQAAKDAIQTALVKPFKDLTEDAQHRLEIQKLIAQGRDDEAEALNTIWNLESQIGPLSEKQLAYVKSMVDYERERSREIERQKALFEAQMDVVDQVKTSLTDVLSGRKTDFLGNIKRAFADLQGKKLFDSIFGDLFADLEKELQGQTPLGRESNRMASQLGVASGGLSDFTKALGGAAAALGGAADAANDNADGLDGVRQAIDGLKNNQTTGWNGKLNPPGAMSLGGSEDGQDIVVTMKRPIDVSGKSAVTLGEKIAEKIVTPFEQVLGKVFGTRFASMLGGVVKEAMAGYMTGGKAGGILGAIKGVVDQTGVLGGAAGKLSGILKDGMGGAATGTQIAGIGKALGLGKKMSTTGAQVGGAIGSMLPIPGGDIIGPVIGGLIGGALRKSKWARVVMSSGGSVMQSNSNKYTSAVGDAGDSFTSSLQNVIDTLGGTMGDFGSIALGVRDGKWRVNTSRASLKKSKGAVNFGEDSEAAMKYAIMQAINKGAVQGIRESTNRLLQAGKDLDKALQDALSWENAFRDLKRYKDPLGAALDDLDKEFEKLIDLANQAGASTEEWAQLQELYTIKQAEIVKETKDNVLGPLTDLVKELSTGDNGLSLRTRRAAALTDYSALASRVSAGDTTAYSDFADAAQVLLGIERDMFGSQKEYFDRFNEVMALTNSRIATDSNVLSITANRDSPFDAAGAVKSTIDNQTEVLSAKLDAVNQNIGDVAAILAAMAANGYSNLATYRVAFAGNY